MRWLSWFRPARARSAPTAAPASPTASPLAVAGDLLAEQTTQSHGLLPWLLGCAAATDAPLAPAEQQALDALDKTLALPDLPDNLLPRAAALIPQLISLVRQTSLPVPEIAERVSKDTVLSAEVMRLASSPYYRVQGDVVTNLAQAITLKGLQGLQTVIARVLLKPIYQASPGPDQRARRAAPVGTLRSAVTQHRRPGRACGPAGIRRLPGRPAARHGLDRGFVCAGPRRHPPGDTSFAGICPAYDRAHAWSFRARRATLGLSA